MPRSKNTARTTHGMSYEPEYSAWASMLTRCNNPRRPQYQSYGGRGISVCERWSKFENFLADVGQRPSASHSLDRINNDGNYEPGNVRWATVEEQQNNRTVSALIEHNGQRRTLTQWARELGLGVSTIHCRLKRGWPVEKALSLSPNRGRKLSKLTPSQEGDEVR